MLTASKTRKAESKMETAVQYLDTSRIINARHTQPPRNRRQDGYGNKIPNAWEVQLNDKRWRRIYTICWSNSGTSYVMVSGKPQYFMSGFQPHEWTSSK